MVGRCSLKQHGALEIKQARRTMTKRKTGSDDDLPVIKPIQKQTGSSDDSD